MSEFKGGSCAWCVILFFMILGLAALRSYVGPVLCLWGFCK